MELYTIQSEDSTIIKHPENDGEWIKMSSEHTIDSEHIRQNS